MANVSAPFGFSLIDSQGKEIKVDRFPKKSGSAIYPGDVVKMAATGDVEVAGAGDIVLGIAKEYKAASDTSEIAIITDPEAVFEVQVSGGAYAAADVFLNANIAATAGDSNLLQSRQSLDLATKAVTATLQFKILGLVVKGDNAVGTFAIIKVRPNEHAFRAGTAGI